MKSTSFFVKVSHHCTWAFPCKAENSSNYLSFGASILTVIIIQRTSSDSITFRCCLSSLFGFYAHLICINMPIYVQFFAMLNCDLHFSVFTVCIIFLEEHTFIFPGGMHKVFLSILYYLGLSMHQCQSDIDLTKKYNKLVQFVGTKFLFLKNIFKKISLLLSQNFSLVISIPFF